jgi:hypothetical protein
MKRELGQAFDAVLAEKEEEDDEDVLHAARKQEDVPPHEVLHRTRTKICVDDTEGIVPVDGTDKILMWAKGDPAVYVLDSVSGACEQTLLLRAASESAHASQGGGVKGCALLPQLTTGKGTNAARVLVWYQIGGLYVWNIDIGNVEHKLSGHTHSVEGCLILDGGAKAISWSADNLRVWCLKTGKCMQRLLGAETHEHEGDAKTSRSDYSDHQLLSCPGWGLVLWNSKESKCHRTMQLGSGSYVILADSQQILAWYTTRTTGKTLLVLWGLKRGHSRKAALQEQRRREPRLQPPPRWKHQWEHLSFAYTGLSIDDCVIFDRSVSLRSFNCFHRKKPGKDV